MRLLLLIVFTSLMTSARVFSAPAQKVITVTVNEIGLAVIGPETFTMDALIIELRTRLFKSYLGTGKMYDAIILKYEGTVDSIIRETTVKALKEAQEKALIDVCLQKHKKKFEDLNDGQQARIRKQFPVLFETDFESSTQ